MRFFVPGQYIICLLYTSGLLPPDYPLICFSLTGYSGGGKKMIAEYEAADKNAALYAPRLYGLNLELSLIHI